jgi:hypothetical protein
MRHRSWTTVLFLFVLAPAAQAQYRGPRSADYLLRTAAWGPRALWVDPGGLGTVHEASLMAELMVERSASGDYPIAQYTLGLSSRGFGFGFRRDRFPDDSAAGNTWRFGFGRAAGPLGFGAAVSLYSGASRKEDVDLGVRFRLAPALELAGGVEHIGQPVVRDSSLRFGGWLGLGLTTFGGALQMGADVHASDRGDAAGVLMAYRAGLRVQLRGKLPIGALAVLDLDNDFKIARLVAGLSVGLSYQGVLVGSGARRAGATRIETLSVTGIATRLFP